MTESAPTETTSPKANPIVAWSFPIAAWLVHHVVCVAALYAGAAWFPAGDAFREVTAVDVVPFFHEYAERPGDFDGMLGVEAGGRYAWAKPLLRWDAWWLLGIAEAGYTESPAKDREDTDSAKKRNEHNVVFFPLFPLIVGALRTIGLPVVIGGLLVNAVASLLAVCVLYSVAQRRSGPDVARWTVLLWLAFPSSFYSIVPYTEALMALFVVLALQAQLGGHDLRTGLLAGLAAGLRPPGMLIGASLVDGWLRGRWLKPTLGMLLSAGGIVGYAIYLGWRFDNPLLFAELQRQLRPNWAPHPIGWLKVLVIGTLAVVVGLGRHRDWWFSSRVTDPLITWWAVLRLPSVRRVSWGWLLASGLMLAMPLSTGSMLSMARFTWAIVPLFLVAGEDLTTSRLRWPTLAIFALLLVYSAFCFGGGWVMI